MRVAVLVTQCALDEVGGSRDDWTRGGVCVW